MKVKILSVVMLALAVNGAVAQTTMKQHTVGHPFTISLPEYMSRTTGVNEDADIEYKNTVKDVYGFVITDDKEHMKLAEISFANIKEFYDEFIKGFIEGEEKVKQSTPISSEKEGIKFMEADVSYYDKNAKTEIYYLIGIVETKTAFYKVLSYSALENKAKFKEDFKKILYSLRD